MKILRLALVIVLSLDALPATAQVRLAELSGTVTDDSGAVLPGVSVIALEVATAQKRSTVTGSKGTYVINALPPGTYEIRAELAKFSPLVVRNLQLGIGEGTRLDLRMQLASLAETVTIQADRPLVETTKSDLTGRIDQIQIEELPLTGRKWMALASLAPGIKSERTGAAGTDVTAGVGDGRMTNVFVDGATVSNSANPHVDIQLSKEIISEFEVATSRFDAVIGHAGTAVVNAVTKSGTDVFRGASFFYWRDDALTAEDFFTGQAEPYSNRQFGGIFGGPIVKSRTHVFLSYEREVEPKTLFATTGIASLDVPWDSTDSRNMYYARLDHSVTARHRLSLRGTGYDRLEPNTGIGGARTISHAVHYEEVIQKYDAGLNSVLGSRLTNQLLVTYMDTVKEGTRASTSPLHLFPTLNIPWKAAGREHPYYWFVRNDTSWLFERGGQHSLKFGTELQGVELRNFSSATAYGVFFYDQDPRNLATCCSAADPGQWDRSQFPAPIRFTKAIGDLTEGRVSNRVYSAYVQDDWRIRHGLTLNLGLRYDLEDGSLGQDNTGVQPQVNSDTNNFQPRLGAVWDVTGTGTTVVRGGAGLYYSQYWLNATASSVTANSPNRGTITTMNPTRNPNFANDPLGGRTVEQLLAGAGVRDVVRIPEDAEQPHVWTGSIGVARQLASNLAVSADYVYQRTDTMIRSIDVNLFCCMPDGNAWPIRTGNYPELGGVVQGRGRPDPRFNQIREDSTNGRSRYHALQVTATKRMGRNYQFGINYLLSHNMADHSGLGSFPNNMFDPDAEYTNADLDQRHRLVANWVSRLPYALTLSGVVTASTASPLSAAGQGVGGGYTGGVDINGDGSVGGDRPTCGRDPRFNPGCSFLGLSNGQQVPPNALTGDSFFKVDIRLAKRVRINRASVDLGVEVFNLFNTRNDAAYNQTLSSPNFGQPVRVVALNVLPRQIQLGARLEF